MVNSQTLFETFVNFEVKFAGLIPDIPVDMDPTGRTDMLRIIDHGKRCGHIVSQLTEEPDAILGLNAYSIRINAKSNEELLLCAPVHMIASVGFVKEEGQNILGLKIGEIAGNKDVSDLAVLYCQTSEIAEMICNLLGQCFQLVFSEATMQYFDKKVVEGATETNLFGQRQSVSSPTSHVTAEGPSFMSGSRPDLSKMHKTRSFSRKHSSTTQTDSDGLSSRAASDLIQEYMRMLHVLLLPEELKQFAILLKRWRSDNLPIREFAQKVLELYGSERKHLLARMRPFIPDADLGYFESFLELSGVSENAESSLPSCSPASDSNYSRSGEFNNSIRLMMTPPSASADRSGEWEMSDLNRNVQRLEIGSSQPNLTEEGLM